jgi:hypothetical protein
VAIHDRKGGEDDEAAALLGHFRTPMKSPDEKPGLSI